MSKDSFIKLLGKAIKPPKPVPKAPQKPAPKKP